MDKQKNKSINIHQIKHKDTEKGQSFTEFALSITFLLILLAGIVDIGRLAFNYIGMRDASQEGVVYGSIYPVNCPEIVDRALAMVVDPNTVDVQVFITHDGTTDTCAAQTANVCTGDAIQVRIVDSDFPITMPFLGTIIGSQTISLNAEISGTVLRPSCTSP
ncbi:MAG: pilus assembly protein [Anaerolineaceae bacterium]|nr:pilus assembly protein [Anaerolineaceae bacterium]